MNGMYRAFQGWRVFWAEEQGPTVTEYAVLLVLIVFGAFATLILIGQMVSNSFTTVSNGLPLE